MPHQTVSLQHHPVEPCPETRSIVVRIERDHQKGLLLSYRLNGHIDLLAIPMPQATGRADGLWEHTCFEAFIAPAEGKSYREFNFSPSGKWAHYAFSNYRQREELPENAKAPEISVCHFPDQIELQVTLDASLLPAVRSGTLLQVGLSAVIETIEGHRTFWALSHSGPIPDFHHRSTFSLNLTAY